MLWFMNNQPYFSIIIPSLNQACYIQNAIESILRQEYIPFEIIIVDGGSQDGTLEILKNLRHESIRWISEPDKGQANAINKGLRMSRGDIVAWLGADDEYEPGAFRKVARFFNENPEAVWVTGKCHIIDVHGKKVGKAIAAYKHLLLSTRSRPLLSIVDYIPQPSTFFYRHLLEEVGYLDENLQYTMDYDLWLRISAKHPIQFLNAYLACFRSYPTSKTRQSAIKGVNEEFFMIRKHVRSPILLSLHFLHRLVNRIAYATVARQLGR